jgi:hypothetical protein
MTFFPFPIRAKLGACLLACCLNSYGRSAEDPDPSNGRSHPTPPAVSNADDKQPGAPDPASKKQVPDFPEWDFQDPTQPSQRMREALAPKREPQPAATIAPTQPPAPPPVPKLPALAVRGLVLGDGGGVAMVSVADQFTVLIRPGTRFHVTADTQQTLVVQVMAITAEGVTLHVPELKQTISLF